MQHFNNLMKHHKISVEIYKEHHMQYSNFFYRASEIPSETSQNTFWNTQRTPHATLQMI